MGSIGWAGGSDGSGSWRHRLMTGSSIDGTGGWMGARSSSLALVTGATGLLGSHIAERLVARGDRVRALVRRASDTAFLESLGVELARGDLTDPASCAA